MECILIAQFFFTTLGSSALGKPVRLFHHQPLLHTTPILGDSYLHKLSTVSFELRPNSFSSLLILVAAAPRPMKRANTGSRLREMRYTGADIVPSCLFKLQRAVISDVNG